MLTSSQNSLCQFDFNQSNQNNESLIVYYEINTGNKLIVHKHMSTYFESQVNESLIQNYL